MASDKLSVRVAVMRLKDLQSAIFQHTITNEPLSAAHNRLLKKSFISELVNVAAVALQYDELLERDFESSEACQAETVRIAKENRAALQALAKAVGA